MKFADCAESAGRRTSAPTTYSAEETGTAARFLIVPNSRYDVVDLRASGQLAVSLGMKLTLAPERVDRRINQQLQQERGKDAADHGRRDALHDVRTRCP